MLNLITLSCIVKIFDDGKCVVSSFSKMLYINCIIHHFKDLEATEENSKGFQMESEYLNYELYKKNFKELEKAEIIIIGFDSTVTFSPLWNRYIDKSMIVKPTYSFDAESVKDYLKGDMFIDMICMKYKLSVIEVKNLILDFAKEQVAVSKKYINENDCKTHFKNWVNYNIQNKKIGSKPKFKTLAT
jgi:hypothetical protein